jgi:large subunit ribosomal protein L21
MYAIIKTGGKQYRVSPGDVIRVETLAGEAGSTVQFPALAVAADGEQLRAGNDAGSVSATIVNNGREKKVIIFKMKRKKQYKRKNGHRQNFTSVRIGEIVAA